MAFAPFPLLWFMLGLFVDKAVFRFWVAGQQVPEDAAGFSSLFPVLFTINYFAFVFLAFKLEGKLSWPIIWICVTAAALTGGSEYLISPVYAT